MAAVNKSTVVEEVIGNINAKYGIEQGITDDFRIMMMNALSSCYLYSSPAGTDKPKAKAGRKRAVDAAAAGADAAEPKAAKKAKAVAEDAAPKERKPRKTSSYNVYVKDMMQSDQVKSAPQKEKMAKIGVMWKDLDDNGKKVYQQRADAENAANPVLAAAASTSATTQP